MKRLNYKSVLREALSFFMRLIFEKSTGMKKAILIHNSTAGDGDHEKQELKNMIEKAGYDVDYYSTNSLFWERFVKKEADIIFVAGGDGTVQKMAKAILDAKEERMLQIPVQILPYGTANNIATTLGFEKPVKEIDKNTKGKAFDIGLVGGIKEAAFFIEGIGCGIFPKLVRVMKSKSEEEKQDEIQQSLQELLKIIDTYEASNAIIIADKKEITGSFLLVELMNIKLIGPNIELAPNAEPGDGEFELVLVREKSREELKAFIKGHLHGNISKKKIGDFAERLKVREVRIKWQGNDVHVDDDIIEEYKREEIVIKNRQAVFKFISH